MDTFVILIFNCYCYCYCFMNTPLDTKEKKSNTVQKLPLQTEKYSKRLEVPYDNVQVNEWCSRSFDFSTPSNPTLPLNACARKEQMYNTTNNNQNSLRNSSNIKLKWPPCYFR